MIRYVVLLSVVILSSARAQSDTVRAISNDIFSQQETSVAISRKDPKLIVVGSNDDAMDVRSMPVYVTTDGGLSWDTYRIPKAPSSYGVIGDPVLLADNDSGFYYSCLLKDAAGHYNILVSHSNDGKSWTYNSPVIAEPSGAIEDKEWIAVDGSPQSPTYGRLYVTWTRLDLGDQTRSGTFISWSDDTGKTWTEAKRFGSFVGTYTLIRIGNSGSIYITYSQFSEEFDSIGHFMSVSNDFGQTFSERRIANFIMYPYDLGLAHPTLKGKLVSFPYLAFAIDGETGDFHAAYGSYDTAHKAAGQYYIRSTDAGISWSSPLKIGDVYSRDQFQPWIVLNKTTPVIFYYSSQDDEKNVLTAPYLTSIDDHTIRTQRLSDTLFNPLATIDFQDRPFIGDYTGADISGQTYAASWTQNRPGFTDGEIFVYINHHIDSFTRGVVTALKPARFMIASIVPNPMVVTTHTQVRMISKIAAHAQVEILDLRGIVMMTLPAEITEGESKIDLIIPGLAAGTYFIRIATAEASVVEKIVVGP